MVKKLLITNMNNKELKIPHSNSFIASAIYMTVSTKLNTRQKL
jgi:hypothetical protein